MQVRRSAAHEHTAPDKGTETTPNDPPVVNAGQLELGLILRDAYIILIGWYGALALVS